LPHSISPRCSAAPKGNDSAQRRLAGLGRRAADRENRQHAVADELQHLAPEGVHRPGDAIEPGVEGGNRRRGLRRLGERREAAQIGAEQRGLDGLADTAAQWTRQHPRGAAPAEIGLESRRQRGARRERGERCGGEARGLPQLVGLVGRERTRPDPAERRPVRPGPDGVLMHDAGRQSGEPAPAGIAGRARRSCGSEPSRDEPSRHEPQGLDHFPALGPPEPSAPSNERVRHGQCQGAARERQAIRDQTRAELRQQPVGAR
jgi:hypothetical protein